MAACNDIAAIDEIVLRLRSELTIPTAAQETGLRLVSEAATAAARDEVEQLPVSLSAELKHFWSQCRHAVFFRDVDYDQWGLDILTPGDALEATRALFEQRVRDARTGDLMIGRFRGDSDFVVIRCAPDADDFGRVIIGLPLDRRADWYFTQMCLSRFLHEFINTRGRKFWELHTGVNHS